MRALFFFLILFSIGCSGQQTKEQSSKIDTLNLFDPKPEPNSGEDAFMFKNCIVLFYPGFTVIHEGTEYTIEDLIALSKHLRKNAALLRQRKFYVLIDSTTKFKKTLSVLDLLQEQKIGNYRVINYKKYFKPPEPITTQTPTVTTRTIPDNDSTFLSIEVLNSGFQLTLLNKEQMAKGSDEVDKFISANKSLIDTNKIKIVSKVNVPYEKFKAILDVLRKHEYYKYKLITQ
jgi:biopolymer transport protein ExbD